MILLNFSHPISDEQQAQIETFTGQAILTIYNVAAHFDNEQPFAEQVREMLQTINLTSDEWQTAPILINPPAYNFAAMTLLAELHGRMGYFPAITRIRPIAESNPPRYEIAEIINLQEVRDTARRKR